MSKIYEALQRADQEAGKTAPEAPRRLKSEAPQRPKKTRMEEGGALPLGHLASALAPLYGSIRRIMDQTEQGIVLHFVSATPGEGTSTIARELAFLAATTGHRRTLHLDGGLAHQTTAFQCPADQGIADPILQNAPFTDLLRPLQGCSLVVGNLKGRDAPSLTAASARLVYGVLRSNFELTIVDCPAISTGGYSNVVPEAADGIVLVVLAEKTRPAVVQHAKGIVEQSGGKFIAAVLNRRQNYIPQFLYRLM